MKPIFLAFLLLFSLNARAELASLFGLGPVSAGMGGTSLFQGRHSPYQSFGAPAALGFVHQVQLDVSTQYMDPHLRPFGTLVQNSSGNLASFDSAGVLSGGGNIIAIALPFGKVRPVTLGGALYLPYSTLIRISGQPVDHPYYPLYTDIARNFFFVVGAGYEPMDGLAIGVNVRSTTKSVAFYNLRNDNSVNYSASVVEGKSESRLSVSVLYDNERAGGFPYSVGAMYRASSGLQTKLIADVSTFVSVQGSVTSLPSYTPAEWVVMSSVRLVDWTLAADLAWVKWSGFVSPYGTGNINTYVVGDLHREANFKDIPVPRFGIDRTKVRDGFFRKIAYRLGYAYFPSPVPNQTGDSNFVDNNRHEFTAGLGTGIENPFQGHDLIDLDLFFQYNHLARREVRKDSALNVGAPGYITGGKILLYGLGASFKF